jgi:hypothetical protein
MYNLKWFSAAVLVSLTFKTPLMKKKHEMKLGLHNYAVIMQI